MGQIDNTEYHHLSDRVSIDNLCGWTIGFVSEENGKSIQIDPNIKDYKRLTLAEIDSQVKVGNVAFCGVDGLGSHAAFKINDPLVREYVFGEDISPVQLTVDAVNDLFASKSKKEFHDKGAGKTGKQLNKYVLYEFKKYLDLWMEQRKKQGIESEWLFVHRCGDGSYAQMKVSTLDSWANIFSNELTQEVGKLKLAYKEAKAENDSLAASQQLLSQRTVLGNQIETWMNKNTIAARKYKNELKDIQTASALCLS